jgi:hypothetical protein
MRMFGKFLVYLNLVLSLVFLGWAVALHSMRLNWAPHRNFFTGEVNQESGQLYELREEMKSLLEHRDLAETRWQTDAAMLPRVEERRAAYLKWYGEQFNLAKIGKDPTGKDAEAPIRRLTRGPDELFIINDPKSEAVKDSRGNAVKSIGYYLNEYQELKKQLDDIQVEIAKLVEQQNRLTLIIAGEPGKTRGVRGQLEDQLSYKKLWEDEIAILRPLLVTQLINVEENKRRLLVLEARLKELAQARRP